MKIEMTCIIGCIDKDGKVWMGGDSASVNGYDINKTALKKVFHRGEFLIGYTTSFRMGQLLEHSLDVREQYSNEDDMAFMVNVFIEAVRELLKSKGFATVANNNETGGMFLVGYRGRLYKVCDDFHVNEYINGMAIIGNGYAHAIGAMVVIDKIDFDCTVEEKITYALEIAEEFMGAVSEPFFILSDRVGK